MVSRGYGIDVIEREIALCDVYCMNCHHELEMEIRRVNRALREGRVSGVYHVEHPDDPAGGGDPGPGLL